MAKSSLDCQSKKNAISLPPGEIVDAGDIFYGGTLFDMMVIDPRKYRGLGRPRKTDYVTIIDAQKIFNSILNKAIDNNYQKFIVLNPRQYNSLIRSQFISGGIKVIENNYVKEQNLSKKGENEPKTM